MEGLSGQGGVGVEGRVGPGGAEWGRAAGWVGPSGGLGGRGWVGGPGGPGEEGGQEGWYGPVGRNVCNARKGVSVCRVTNALLTSEDRKSWRKMGGGVERKYT